MLKSKEVKFKDTGAFNDLVIDYLSDEAQLRTLYNEKSDIKGLLKIAKARNFNGSQRSILVKELKSQYRQINIKDPGSSKVLSNIDLLEKENTLTVTTGHQLCLFTGPLYFIYKIFSTINLAEKLSKESKDHNFVPIYWMATEDHDFEEINHFNSLGSRYTWNNKSGGPVGRMNTKEIKKVFHEFENQIGHSSNSKRLKELFENAYTTNDDLTSATRYLVHELFKKFGLICLDGDSQALKEQFKDHMSTDLFENLAYDEVSKTNERLAGSYKIQVNPRQINLFLLKEGERYRIEREGDDYTLVGSEFSLSRDEIRKELDDSPENFSPNVILRPLYQETVLPNVAYIGGGGELSYWLQLRSFFQKSTVSFPGLVLRNSVMWVDRNTSSKLDQLGMTPEEFFNPLKDIYGKYVSENAEANIVLKSEESEINEWFDNLLSKTIDVDPGLDTYVNAYRQKTLNKLDDLKKRLVRAEKKKQEVAVNRITTVKNNLFSGGSLQERQTNFSELFLQYGDLFFEILKDKLDPIDSEFLIIYEEIE